MITSRKDFSTITLSNILTKHDFFAQEGADRFAFLHTGMVGVVFKFTYS